MKKTLLFSLISICVFCNVQSKAQCSFTPVITPGDLILCPDATSSISTTEAFDTYQWYKNNKLVAGATGRNYAVSFYEDAASYFKVTVTRNGCTATSQKVLVDGYAFASPVIISSGDLGVYDPSRGVFVECPGDTMILTYPPPYTQNVQWYNNYNPITGAVQGSYEVTKKGSFTVCGSPAVCPDFVQCQFIPVDVTYSNVKAAITQSNDTLYASDAKHFQWFHNGRVLPGAGKNFIVPNKKGSYTVSVADKYTCTAVSAPFVLGADKLLIDDIIAAAPNPVKDVLHVHLKKAGWYRMVIADFYGSRFADTQLNADANISLSNLHTGTFLLQLFNSNGELIGTKKIFKE